MAMEPEVLHQLVLALAGFIMLLAAFSDALRFRIPNLACLALALLFPLFVLTAPTAVPWTENLAVFAIVLGAGYVLYVKKWAGAGDIKFIAVLSLWAGPSFWGQLLFITAISGGILSLGIGALTILRHRLSKAEGSPALAKTPIPYGVAIAVGGLCTLALLSHPDLLTKV